MISFGTSVDSCHFLVIFQGFTSFASRSGEWGARPPIFKALKYSALLRKSRHFAVNSEGGCEDCVMSTVILRGTYFSLFAPSPLSPRRPSPSAPSRPFPSGVCVGAARCWGVRWVCFLVEATLGFTPGAHCAARLSWTRSVRVWLKP